MKKTIIALSLATTALAAPALAQSKGDMTLGFGLAWVNPKDSYSSAANLKPNDNARPSLTFEYFIADNVGLEVLAAWPFEHDVAIAGGGNVAKIKHLPPTVSIQYHFANASSITPFIGAGINYTHFWDEKGVGVLAGTPVSLDDSWGLALHAGIDVAVSERGALRADVRWIDIDSEVKVGGASVGDVNIDPWVVGVAYVLKF